MNTVPLYAIAVVCFGPTASAEKKTKSSAYVANYSCPFLSFAKQKITGRMVSYTSYRIVTIPQTISDVFLERDIQVPSPQE